MAFTALKTSDGQDRIRNIRHKGVQILLCDYSGCSRDEGRVMLDDLLARLKEEPDSSVSLLSDCSNTVYDPSQATEWKKHLELFNARIKKSAVTGLGPMNRFAIAGIRMYAKLMGQEKVLMLTQVFETRESAMEYLATEK